MKEGWENYFLGDIAHIGAGNSAPQKKELFLNGTIPFVRTSDVGQIRIGSISETRDRLNEEGVRKMRLVPAGSVLVPKSGASTFLNHRVKLARDAYVSSHLATIKARPEFALDSFVYYFLMTVRAQDLIQDHKYPSLKLSDLNNIAIDLPSPRVQKRIVAILDEAFTGIDTAIANTEKNLANARNLFESSLSNVFTKRDEGWKETKLRDVCNIKHGFAFKSEFFVKDSDYVVLTPGSFYESGGFRDQGKKTKYYQGEIPDGYLMDKGMFLIAMTEQAAGLLGSPLIVPEASKYLHNQRLGLVQPFDDVEWHNDFFFHQLNTREFRDAVQLSASGVKVRHTSPTKLGEIDICFPPTIGKQKEIADRLNEIQEEVRKLASSYQQKLNSLKELKQSLLQKAFSGELTATKATTEAILKEEEIA
ncbi:MAG: restriction endonuclease subunit S [Porticoccus sp.]|nr:MAG: restriction endonuclease subunit S [Porticoccus sp.]